MGMKRKKDFEVKAEIRIWLINASKCEMALNLNAAALEAKKLICNILKYFLYRYAIK